LRRGRENVSGKSKCITEPTSILIKFIVGRFILNILEHFRIQILSGDAYFETESSSLLNGTNE